MGPGSDTHPDSPEGRVHRKQLRPSSEHLQRESSKFNPKRNESDTTHPDPSVAVNVSLPPWGAEIEFLIDNLLVRVHLIIEMILVDRPCAMGVWIPFSR